MTYIDSDNYETIVLNPEKDVLVYFFANYQMEDHGRYKKDLKMLEDLAVRNKDCFEFQVAAWDTPEVLEVAQHINGRYP